MPPSVKVLIVCRNTVEPNRVFFRAVNKNISLASLILCPSVYTLAVGLLKSEPLRAMPSRPPFKQEDSFGPSDHVFELQSYGDKTEATKAGEKYTETTLAEDHGENYKGSTAHDQRDMDRLGKKQELRVSHRNQL